jgi:hypothetical protein
MRFEDDFFILIGFCRDCSSKIQVYLMEIHQSLEPHETKITRNNSIDRVRRKHKEHKNCERERSFYRLAAAIANPVKDEMSEVNGSLLHYPQEFNSSCYLESSYQERSPVFIAKRLRWQPAEAGLIESVIRKWRAATGDDDVLLKDHLFRDWDNGVPFFEQPQKTIVKNGVSFSSGELSTLLLMLSHELIQMLSEYFTHSAYHLDSPMRVLDFHCALFERIHEKHKGPLVLLGAKKGINFLMVCDRVRLFWSHRMHLKSRQTRGGAEPLIRYFHAAFRLSEYNDHKIDILYWLGFDHEQKPRSGEFINAIDTIFSPQILMSARTLIEHVSASEEKLIRLSPKKCSLLQEVLKMYLEATTI